MDPLREKLEKIEFEFADQDLRAAAFLREKIATHGAKGEGVTITYGDLVSDVPFQLERVNSGRPFEIDPHHWTDLNRRVIGDFLAFLSRESYLRARFLASAL